jgi:hypothetical protein
MCATVSWAHMSLLCILFLFLKMGVTRTTIARTASTASPTATQWGGARRTRGSRDVAGASS